MEKNERQKLSRVMCLSWDIQTQRRKTRANALKAAWAIISNEEITVYYLIKKVSPEKIDPAKAGKQLGLFRFE